MIMGQTKLIHEHYDRSPWVSIVAGVLIAGLAILKLFDEKITTASVITFALTALPIFLILILRIFSRNNPSLVVYNDRLEV